VPAQRVRLRRAARKKIDDLHSRGASWWARPRGAKSEWMRSFDHGGRRRNRGAGRGAWAWRAHAHEGLGGVGGGGVGGSGRERAHPLHHPRRVRLAWVHAR
jgi:hypothetical protein